MMRAAGTWTLEGRWTGGADGEWHAKPSGTFKSMKDATEAAERWMTVEPRWDITIVYSRRYSKAPS